MTKKTNSLLLRYGVSALWKQKNTYWTNIVLFNKLIISVLKYYNFYILKINYKQKNCLIFVYNSPCLENKLQSIILNYYKKKVYIHYLINKFGIGSKQITWVLGKNCRLFTISNININKDSWLYALELKKLLIIMLLSIFKNIVTSCCINIIVNKFFFLKNTIKNNFILKKHSFIFKISKHLQLRKINGFLKLKVIMLLLEIFIFSTLHLKIKITLKNVFLNKGLFIYPVMGSLAKKEILRFQFYTIFFSTYFFCSELLANYIAKLLVIGKQHLKILKRFILFFESFFYNNILVLQGLQLRITGKLGGKMRASKFHYKIGVVNLQSIISSCNYEMATAFTKYGVLSIKLWLLKKNAIDSL